MPIEDVKDLIEEVWSEAQDDILHDLPSGRSMSTKEVNRFLI
jgi:hypothetical protein